MPTAGLYTRQSFYKEDSCSIDMQIERSKAFCVSQGWDYIIYDADQGYSGKDTDRPGFRQMMKDIHAGNINFVVVYKLDRISRNLRDFFELMEEFKTREVGFRSITESFDTTTPFGRAMLSILAVFAQLERETTAERVHDNMVNRARMGIWNGGPIPFGFKTHKESMQIGGKSKQFSVLGPEEIEMQGVTKFFSWYLETSGSIRSNVIHANNAGIPTKIGKAWNPNQMQRILSNPLYCTADQAAWNYFSSLDIQIASDISDFDGLHGLIWYNRRKAHKKTTRLRSQSEWVLAVGGHLGKIPGEIFVAVQKKLEANKIKAPREGTGKKGLLASLIKCGKCHRAMTFSDYGKWQYYRCSTKQQQGSCLCDGQTVKAAELEQAVISAIKTVCANRAFLDGIARQAVQNVDINIEPLLEDKKRVTAHLDALLAEQKEMIKALGKKSLPVELIEERIHELDKDKDLAARQLAEIDIKLDSQDYQKIDMDLVFGNLLKFNDVFDAMDFDEKRNFLGSIVKKIIYLDGKITMHLFFLPDFSPDKPPGKKSPPGSDSSSGGLVMNGCPCGHYGSELECTCTPLQIQRYLGRVSGPLLDRMDLHVEVPRVKWEQLREGGSGESSANLRQRVTLARDIQQKRFKGSKININSQMRPAELRRHCRLDDASHALLKDVFEKLRLSARAYDRVLKIARTIADLEQSENIQTIHLGEALQYRSLDRKYWSL